MTKFRTQASIRLPMFIDHNAIHNRIKDLETLEEKRALIEKGNPLFYALGNTLTPTNHYTREYRDGQIEASND